MLLLLFSAFSKAAKAEESGKAARSSSARVSAVPNYDGICRQIKQAAEGNGLEANFFARVIWQESRFNPSARSRAGAQGIAQFMPATASSRGLLDPFDPADALRESASYLRELNKTFGNLGLAAAAYNAGPGRLTRWMSGKGQLPQETLAYVQIVTGRSIAEWSAEPVKGNDDGIANDVPCPTLASLAANSDTGKQEIPLSPTWLPWGVQLLGDWTKDEVLASYEKLRRTHLAVLGQKDPMIVVAYGPSGMTKRFLVRVAENTQEEAQRSCAQLRLQKVACFVIRNPTEQEALAKARRYARLLSYARMSPSHSVEVTRRLKTSSKQHLVNHSIRNDME